MLFSFYVSLFHSFPDALYRKSINEAILKMQESGKLHRLKEKWWKEMNGGGQCQVRQFHKFLPKKQIKLI